MVSLIFLHGGSPFQNDAIHRELLGHVRYMGRDPNLAAGELGMRLVDGSGAVIAEGYNDVYDKAREIHVRHVRKKLSAVSSAPAMATVGA